MSDDDSDLHQQEVCRRFGAEFVPVSADQKIGIARDVLKGRMPINGLRHRPVGDTSGWYVWSGENFSDAPDFFVPLHIEHVDEWSSQIRNYLGLAPGWRFLLADGYEDVWFDPQLLNAE